MFFKPHDPQALALKHCQEEIDRLLGPPRNVEMICEALDALAIGPRHGLPDRSALDPRAQKLFDQLFDLLLEQRRLERHADQPSTFDCA
jgi:hypothetical protein